MENKKLKWCFELKEGIKITEPSERLARSYLEQAKSSLERAQKTFNDGDLLWTTVIIYYAEYYALYAFLQRIGMKCENHSCSILSATLLLGESRTQTINQHKDKRIDAQYYMKIDKEEQISQMLNEAKTFISTFDEITSNITENETRNYRIKLNNLK